MKEFYEQVPKIRLVRRMPVMIRIDGKAFHTFTNGFKKPFDDVLIESMQETMKYLCENIQGCVFGYTQSDEITLIIIEYKKLTSSAWFDYEVQKMVSVSASMATMFFNKILCQKYDDFFFESTGRESIEEYEYFKKYEEASKKGAIFDSRCFNVPKEEVTNFIYWRQLDAIRNSIQMLGQANFSHKELQNKTCNMIQDMLFTEKGINWNDLPVVKKRGSACIKDAEGHWFVDENMPILKTTDEVDYRHYVDKLIDF
jgi:tRNA(His) 5'-end guanylyltransferase